jgi:hypothetical protein
MISNGSFSRAELEFIRNEMYASTANGAEHPMFDAVYQKAKALLIGSPVETIDYRAKAEKRADKIHQLRAALGRILSMAVTIGCDAGHAGIEAECRAALEVSPEETTAPRQRLRDSDAAFDLGVLPTELPEKASVRHVDAYTVDALCGCIRLVTDGTVPQFCDHGHPWRLSEKASKTLKSVYIHYAAKEPGDGTLDKPYRSIAEAMDAKKASAPACGNPAMINSERYRGCVLPSGHDGECSPREASGRPSPEQLGERWADTLKALANDDSREKASETPEQQRAAIDAAALADAHRMYEQEHGEPFPENGTEKP